MAARNTSTILHTSIHCDIKFWARGHRQELVFITPEIHRSAENKGLCMEPEASLWKILTNLTYVRNKIKKKFPKFDHNPKNARGIANNKL